MDERSLHNNFWALSFSKNCASPVNPLRSWSKRRFRISETICCTEVRSFSQSPKERLEIRRPEFMVLLNRIKRQRSERISVDLHDQAMRRKMRVHPIEREAFFHVKFPIGIFLED